MTSVVRIANLKRQYNSARSDHANQLGYFTPILGAAVAAIAISAAPLASADTSTPPGTLQQSCSSSGGGTVCQSPGNVQINDAPGPVQFYPYGGEAFLL
jgi:hypothetical protein